MMNHTCHLSCEEKNLEEVSPECDKKGNFGLEDPRCCRLSWSRSSVASCDCLELPFTHVHCPCVKCCGEAKARRVELRHWKKEHALHESDTDLHSEKREKNASIQDNGVDNLLQLGTDEECSMSFRSDLGNNEMDSSSDPYDRCESQLSPDSEQSFAGSELLNASMPNLVSGEDNERVDDSNVSESEPESNSKNEASQLKELIADAVIDAMKIVENYGSSTKEFEDVLSLGKKLLANNISNIDNDLVEVLWPNNWQQAQEILASGGYKGAHQYYVCFCKEEREFKKDGITLKKTVYNGNWDVMHANNTPCKHCGMPGKIKLPFTTSVYIVRLLTGLKVRVCVKTAGPLASKGLLAWKEL